MNLFPGNDQLGRYRVTAAVLAVGLALLSLGLHFVVPSTLHQTEQEWQERLAYHRDVSPFDGRPFTTAMIEGMQSTGLSIRFAIFCIHTVFLALIGLAIIWCLRRMGFDRRLSLGGSALFLLSFPVLLAHLEPILTWDDYWVYLCFPLSLGWLYQRKLVPSVVALVVMLLGRESSILLIPGWLLAAQERIGWKRGLFALVACGIAVTAIRVGIIGRIVLSGERPILFNFESWLRFSDAIFSLFVSLGAIWVIGIRQALSRQPGTGAVSQWLRRAAVLTVLLTVIIAMMFTYARESRLFVPAAFFLIPCCLDWWRERREDISRLWQSTSTLLRFVMPVVVIALSIAAAKLLFPEFEYRRWRDGNWGWFGVHLSIIAWFVLVEIRARVSRNAA